MARTKATPVRVRNFNGIVMVSGMSAAEVRAALALAKRKRSVRHSAQVRTALKLHDVVGRFFKNGGKFKTFKHKKRKK
jgi:hypothetical protein